MFNLVTAAAGGSLLLDQHKARGALWNSEKPNSVSYGLHSKQPQLEIYHHLFRYRIRLTDRQALWLSAIIETRIEKENLNYVKRQTPFQIWDKISGTKDVFQISVS